MNRNFKHLKLYKVLTKSVKIFPYVLSFIGFIGLILFAIKPEFYLGEISPIRILKTLILLFMVISIVYLMFLWAIYEHKVRFKDVISTFISPYLLWGYMCLYDYIRFKVLKILLIPITPIILIIIFIIIVILNHQLKKNN